MMTPLLEKARRFLTGRAGAYQRVFAASADVDTVLRDLVRFCRATETTFHPNQRVSDALNGRREVWLRIQHHLKMTDDELWQRYGSPSPPTKGD
jgi:hypothetical protein